MRERLLRGCTSALVLLVCAPAASHAEGPYEIIVRKNVMIVTRDGIKLATDIYLPGHGGVVAPGKFPAILERTPYNKDGAEIWASYFVPHGFAAVAQDVRGRFASGGNWRPHRDDGVDGYDTAKWIGEQPWSDGGIGTVGTSYPGGIQHALAIANAPHLKAMIPVDAMSNCGRYGIRHNGAFELRWLNWILTSDFPGGIQLNVGDSIMRARYRDSLERASLMKPGKVYQFTIEMYPTSLVFKRGHRIRLDISSSNFPRFDVNPNTGEPLEQQRQWAVAENSIYHDGDHPTHIVLPIIPRITRAEAGQK
jgi:predicted acyl esterase